MDPLPGTSKFVDLLYSQQTVSFGNFEDNATLSSTQVPFRGSVGTEASNFDGDSAAGRTERRKILWLGTSKHPPGFGKGADYFSVSPLVSGLEEREPTHCKQRWHRINDLVSKFCGAYEAATREKTSGQNENDVVKLDHQIFYNNYQKRFTLEHAWKELRHDQKK
uniref:No apical meristem-associated C-terminal domain-containing protein n=1 Tax=Brassica oleracea var. oleracea TaxID=109376 RepID=A0A0D3ABJ4_BRAOL